MLMLLLIQSSSMFGRRVVPNNTRFFLDVEYPLSLLSSLYVSLHPASMEKQIRVLSQRSISRAWRSLLNSSPFVIVDTLK